MRVACVCADPGVPVFGSKGCSIHVREVIDALRRAHVRVELFAARFDGDRPADWDDVAIHALPSPPRGDPAAREIAAIAGNAAVADMLDSRGPFDFVYERYSLWSHAAMEFARARHIPGILEVNAPLVHEQAAHRTLIHHDQARAIAARVFSTASAVVAVSDAVADHVLSVAPSAAGRVHVTPNGVDHRRFVPDAAPALPELRDRFVIGFSGSMKPWHGLEPLFAAFETIRHRIPHAHLLLVGDGSELSALREAAAASGCADALTFTGAVRSEAMPGMLASMHVAVAPYPARHDFYFSPLKVVEYMAAGRAVVASRIGQIEDMIDHEATGLLCEPGDVQDLARAIERLTDAELRHRLGRAARARVLGGYTWDHVAQRILAMAGAGREVLV